MTTAKEHYDWCMERAEEYLDRGDAQGGFSSFASDVRKHEELSKRITPELLTLGMFDILAGPEAVRRFIKGFPSP